MAMSAILTEPTPRAGSGQGAGINAGINIHGMIQDAAGQPSDELAEMAALHLARRVAGRGAFNLLNIRMASAASPAPPTGLG